MRKLLVSLKGELCKIAQEMEKKRDRSVYLTEEDKIDARHGKTEIDYLLHLIDGFLLGYYEPSDDNISDFTESVISVAVMQLRFDLLNYVKPFSKILK